MREERGLGEIEIPNKRIIIKANAVMIEAL